MRCTTSGLHEGALQPGNLDANLQEVDHSENPILIAAVNEFLVLPSFLRLNLPMHSAPQHGMLSRELA